MAGDQHWYSVSCLLHMDTTGLSDVKGNTVTLTGNVARSATQSKFGGYSAVFDGSGDYLGLGTSSSFDLSTGDFTIEFFVYVTTTSTYYAISRRPTNGWLITITGGGAAGWNQWSSGGTYDSAASAAGAVTQNAWNHVAICRSGDYLTVYVNGTGGTALNSANRPDSASGTFYIGQDPTTPARAFAGYIDEFRFTKGVARYSGNFTPPSTAFPDEYVSVSGTTKDSSRTLASRLVRVYRQDTGAFVGEQLSNGTTGVYKITAANTGSTVTKHFAVMHDDDANPPTTTENALIYDDITPA